MTHTPYQLAVDVIDQLTIDQASCKHQPMVDTQEIRDAFAARLNAALDDVADVRVGRGRNVDFHALMKAKAPGFNSSKQATHKWLRAESMPEKDNMRMIARVTGVRAEWLEYGDGPMREGIAEPPADYGVDKESNVIAADFSSKGRLKDGELSIPQYNVRGALGHGQIPADYIETIRHVTVHESMLSGRGISFSKADNLAIITGFGQSMEGTINDGDPLIVDRGISQFIGDGIYVLTWDNLLYVKRLQKHSPIQFDMISDNPLHKDQVINIADVTIHARVLLVWNAKKL